MYNTIIFDLDDTLCNYKQSKINAKKSISNYLNNLNIDSNKYWTEFDTNFNYLFEKYISNEITLSNYQIMRFKHNGITLEQAKQINNIYINCTVEKIELFDDVDVIMTYIFEKNMNICILTNGPSKNQRLKILNTGLYLYNPSVFISSEIGICKPNCLAFQYVLDKLNIKPENAIMVGDSLENDYIPANNVGIKPYLINREKNTLLEHNINSITSLTDLIDIIRIIS